QAESILTRMLENGQSVYGHIRDLLGSLTSEHKIRTVPASYFCKGYLPLREGRVPFKIVALEEQSSQAGTNYMVIMDPGPTRQIWEKLPGGMSLTPREKEIIGLMARGKTNKEIGHALMISENTVKTYVKRVFSKMGVNSRVELICCFLKHTNTFDQPGQRV
ncbi:MAG: response regulator transcription factor, partial [Desulfocucumaceae bacterium]